MNTELLREDERFLQPSSIELLRQRLIEAREIIRDGFNPTCECDWCLQARDYLRTTTASVPK